MYQDKQTGFWHQDCAEESIAAANANAHIIMRSAKLKLRLQTLIDKLTYPQLIEIINLLMQKYNV